MKSSIILPALFAMTIAPSLSFASSTDGKIEDAAKASYNFHVVLQDRVNVKSEDGVVTLTGTLPDRDEKTLAEDTVSNLPGVVRVVDNITIEEEPPARSDAWIATKIRMDLLVHANVSATSTQVQVNDGVVLLTGTVDNIAQKELTEAYVKDIEGVKSVNNALVVKENPAEDHTVGAIIDDASITSQVKYALLSHRSTSALRTKITTNGGNVLVRGDADSDAEKDLVTKLTNGVRGVKSVDNEMTVKVN
jgi:hyperosmotically inducible periplasmic protein